MKFLFLLLVFLVSKGIALDQGKRVIILGGGVTGTWAAAKIASYLKSTDELWIVIPPPHEVVKDLGKGVFCNYTTSAFIPIGIQTEIGVLNAEPPTREDVAKAKELKHFDINSKLFISFDLDPQTQRKLDQLISKESKEIQADSLVLMHYHRDVCYKEWQKYIQEGGKGADFNGTVVLGDNFSALENFRKKIIYNRKMAGYPTLEEDLQVLDSEELEKHLPRYAQLIKTKKLKGVLGFNYDGRVKSNEVMDTLHAKIEKGPAKITRIFGWVDSLQMKNITVTGIKLRNGDVIDADVVVSALGQGVEEVLKTANQHVPILKKWGVVYSLPQDQKFGQEEAPTIMMRGLGIVRDVPTFQINCGLGEWILPEGKEPDVNEVRHFVEQSVKIWEKGSVLPPIYVQPRPMTLDGLPVLDSTIKGLVVLNPSGSQGNTQAPGSALFAASKVLEQLGREIPSDLHLPDSVDWKFFELANK